MCFFQQALRTCIHSRGCRVDEGFSRQTRRVFAGILCVLQENATQYGGKRPVHTAFEVVNTGSQGVASRWRRPEGRAISTVGHPLKNPPFTRESDRSVSGYPSGAERIRTRGPLFPLPLPASVIGTAGRVRVWCAWVCGGAGGAITAGRLLGLRRSRPHRDARPQRSGPRRSCRPDVRRRRRTARRRSCRQSCRRGGSWAGGPKAVRPRRSRRASRRERACRPQRSRRRDRPAVRPDLAWGRGGPMGRGRSPSPGRSRGPGADGGAWGGGDGR